MNRSKTVTGPAVYRARYFLIFFLAQLPTYKPENKTMLRPLKEKSELVLY